MNELSNLDKVYWMLADKYNLRKEQIEEIVLCQFRFIHNVISSTDIRENPNLKGINITHLGKFIPRKKMIAKHLKFYAERDSSNI